jgi:hypothetical protein
MTALNHPPPETTHSTRRRRPRLETNLLERLDAEQVDVLWALFVAQEAAIGRAADAVFEAAYAARSRGEPIYCPGFEVFCPGYGICWGCDACTIPGDLPTPGIEAAAVATADVARWAGLREARRARVLARFEQLRLVRRAGAGWVTTPFTQMTLLALCEIRGIDPEDAARYRLRVRPRGMRSRVWIERRGW